MFAAGATDRCADRTTPWMISPASYCQTVAACRLFKIMRFQTSAFEDPGFICQAVYYIKSKPLADALIHPSWAGDSVQFCSEPRLADPSGNHVDVLVCSHEGISAASNLH